MLHSSDFEPEKLRYLLARQAAEDEARGFRRYFLTRIGIVVFVVWLLSWPIHALPHTVLWSMLATAALVVGLTSPRRTRPASRDTRPTHRR